MSPATLQRERFADWLVEAMPLLQRHWRELARFKDIPLNVNVPAYLDAEARGVVHLYTARDGDTGDLLGYALYFVGTHPHYADVEQAIQDVFYVTPERRGSVIGLRLIKFADEQLAAEGITFVVHHVKKAHPELGKLLAHVGYEEIESTWMRRLPSALGVRGPVAGGRNASEERTASPVTESA